MPAVQGTFPKSPQTSAHATCNLTSSPLVFQSCPSRQQRPAQFQQTQRCKRPSSAAASEVTSSKNVPAVSTPRQIQTSKGSVIIRPLEAEDLQGACVVMTRAFANDVTMAEALKHVGGMLGIDPTSGVYIIARIVPTDPSALPPGKQSRLIGTVALSLRSETLPPLPQPLPPPLGSAYISNMSVDVSYRRLGIATALLRTCEEIAAARGMSRASLHVRQDDAAAVALYQGAGYEELSRDAKFESVRLRIKPRILMMKELQLPD